VGGGKQGFIGKKNSNVKYIKLQSENGTTFEPAKSKTISKKKDSTSCAGNRFA
jgi:hypothetical protein